MNKVVLAIGGLLIFILLIIMIVLASLYGTDHNCDTKSASKEPMMTHFPRIKDTTLTALAGDSNAYMKTIAYSPYPNGKEMQGGLLRLDAGPALEYLHWYEGIMFTISGEFNITDGTGKTFMSKAGDSMSVKAGTTITYRAATSSFMYYVAHPPGPENCATINEGVASNPTITRAKNSAVHSPDIPLFPNEDSSLSYLEDTLFSQAKDEELTGGLYKLLKGPALDYRYVGYPEFKYIVSGEFQLTDGTGQYVSAKGGDLMYFPEDTWVHFTSPSSALGFYVGQRKGGEA